MRHRAIALVAAAGAAVGAVDVGAGGIRVVGYEGQPIGGGSLRIDWIRSVVMRPDGRVLFEGWLTDEHRRSLPSLWIEDHGSQTIVVAGSWLAGDYVVEPDLDSWTVQSDSDEIYFDCDVRTFTYGYVGGAVARWSSGAISLVSLDGEELRQDGPRMSFRPSQMLVGPQGDVFATAVPPDSEPHRTPAFYRIRGDSAALVQRLDGELDGTQGRFGSLGLWRPWLQSGVIFAGTLRTQQGVINWPNDSAVWTWTPEDGLRMVVSEGQPAPGVAGAYLDDVRIQDVAADGRVIIVSHMRDRPTLYGRPISRPAALWIGPPDDLRLLVREGDPAPGLPGEVATDGGWSLGVGSARFVPGGVLLDVTVAIDPGSAPHEGVFWVTYFLPDAGEPLLLFAPGLFPLPDFLPAGRHPGSLIFGVDGPLLAGWHVAAPAQWPRDYTTICSLSADGAPHRILRTPLDAPIALDTGVVARTIFGIEPMGRRSSEDPWPIVNDRGECALVVLADVRFEDRRSSGFRIALAIDTSSRNCPEDLDGDGCVGSRDLAFALAHWGERGFACARADLEGNLTVSAADLALLLAAWGPCGGSDFVSVGAR